ncbi:MAG: hypothetical protein KGJ35_02475, partial [Patescibacteria group bacterium]|nr:hypothetical protein [Patescibacteria group bacterium]
MPPALSFRAIEKMRDVLMDSSAKNPAVFYYMIRGGESEGNITVIEHGTANGEYIKTYGHYHIIDFIETYTVVLGEAILLLQTRKPGTNGPIDDEIDDFKAIRLQTGDSIK